MGRLFTLLLLLPAWVMAQSSLPRCPEVGYKHNCFGTESLPAGVSYSGEFQRDQWHGRGTYNWPGIERYIGEFRSGKREGIGELTLPGGRRYVGEFTSGKMTGVGIEYSRDGSISRSGSWREGYLITSHRVDSAKFPLERSPLDGNQARRLSTCGNDQPVSTWNACIGTIPTSGNGRFVGVFINGARSGPGVEYESSGRVFRSGDWDGWKLVREYPLRDNSYAFQDGQPASAAGSPTPVDRERLLAEVQAERTRRQELEEELERRRVAEARDRPQASRPAKQRSERRVALIIGNSTYKVSPLPNPSNDATDIDEALRRSGFQTTLIRDATLGQMREATRKFADQLTNSDVALIYFAGHGIEANRKNYMIPVNADLKFEYELADQGYDAGIWLEMLESIKSNNADRVNIVILDACRNNTLIGSRNLGRGLGKMDAPTGTFLAYSTAPGRVAADGARGERNSPFTKHLLRAMQQPGLPIEEVFKEVRRNVSRETSGAQVPWESTSLTGYFSFSQPR
jgi:hypothetical protein